MSSQILTSIPIDTIKSNLGGIKSIFVMPFENISGSVTVATGSVVSIPISASSGFSYARYDFRKQTGTFKDDLKISDENASVYSDQDVTVEFTRVEIGKRNALLAAAVHDLSVIVLDNLGQYWLYGKKNGLVPMNNEADSGKKYGDGSKYKLKLVGVEDDYAPLVPTNLIPGLLLPA